MLFRITLLCLNIFFACLFAALEFSAISFTIVVVSATFLFTSCTPLDAWAILSAISLVVEDCCSIADAMAVTDTLTLSIIVVVL